MLGEDFINYLSHPTVSAMLLVSHSWWMHAWSKTDCAYDLPTKMCQKLSSGRNH